MPIVVTVVVPVRDEERYVGMCLRSILGGTYLPANMEILVLDGRSSDRTRDIVMDIARRNPVVRLLDNPGGHAAGAMNLGIRAARGTFLVRIDAHSTYPPDYIERLLAAKEMLDADNVGGAFITQPGGSSAQARAVPFVLTHPFGVGNAMYRLRQERTPYEVDTVPYGCYSRELLERIGMFDESFVRNQDDELNARLRLAGGRIYLLPDLHIHYFARDTLRKMGGMFYQYGYFKPRIMFKLGRPMTLRQLAPPAFVTALLGLPPAGLLWPGAVDAWFAMAAIYVGTACVTALCTARRQGWRVVCCVAVGFAVAHLSYGFGYLRGIVDSILRMAAGGKDKRDCWKESKLHGCREFATAREVPPPNQRQKRTVT
jgi:GT2 family glycosyltransferase